MNVRNLKGSKLLGGVKNPSKFHDFEGFFLFKTAFYARFECTTFTFLPPTITRLLKIYRMIVTEKKTSISMRKYHCHSGDRQLPDTLL